MRKIITLPSRWLKVILWISILSSIFSPRHLLAQDVQTYTANSADELINAINQANTDGTDSEITLTGTTYQFFNNLGQEPDGNALPPIVESSTLTINGNGATITAGVGADNFRYFIVELDATLVLNNLTISNGQPFDGSGGGAILNRGVLNIGGCSFIDNLSGDNDGADGGAIYNEGGEVTIRDAYFFQNFATGLAGLRGGAIYQESGALDIIRSTFENNNAVGRGGALFIQGGTTTVTNCTFFQNTDEAIVVNGGFLRMTHCTLSENTANNTIPSAGGILNLSGTVELNNTIVAGNSASFSGTPDLSGEFVDLGGNLIGVADGSNFSPGLLVGTSVIPVNANFMNYGLNGGVNPNLSLASNSLAIGQAVNGRVLDQRGFLRDDQPDIGAHEANSELPKASPYSVTNLNNSGIGSFRYALVHANFANVAASNPYIIDFSTTGNIIVESPLPDIKNHMTIRGNVSSLDGQDDSPLLRVSGAFNVIINNLIFQRATAFDVTRGQAFTNDGGTVRLNLCRFRENTFQGSGGACIFNASGNLDMIDCTVDNNFFGGSNGSGLIDNQANLRLNRCTIHDNVAFAEVSNGGAIRQRASAGTLDLTNCTIFNNNLEAGDVGQGGGLFIEGGTSNIYNCTIVNNVVSGMGGGVYLMGGSLNMFNTVLVGNQANTQPDIFLSPSSESNVSHCIIESSDGFEPTGVNDNNLEGLNYDAVFGGNTLTNNGGNTSTIALIEESPAIDMGTTGADIPNVDQTNASRIGQPDIGAYEFPTAVAAPQVSTTSVTNRREDGAVANGNLLAEGSGTVSSRGFIYYLATGTNLTINDSEVTLVEVSTGSTSTFSATITGLSPGSQYSVRAYATSEVGTSYGTRIDFWTLAKQPNPVTGLTAATGTNEATLTWNNQGDATGYLVITNAGSVDLAPIIDGLAPEEVAASINADQVVSISGDQSSITVTGLVSSTAYTFYVIPFADLDGVTETTNYQLNSPSVNEFTSDIPPNAPSGLTAQVASGTGIVLRWVDNSSNEIGFEIERAIGASSSFIPLDIVLADTTSYTDTQIKSGVTYRYRVLAFNTAGESPTFSNVATATTFQPPATPANLRATAISLNQIDLEWEDRSSNEDNFVIERATNFQSGFVGIATVAANIESYTDNTVAGNTQYFYRIRAVSNTQGVSGFSNVAGAQTANIPIAPTSLDITNVTSNEISLIWTDNSSNEEGFSIERSNILEDLGDLFIEVAQVSADVTTYTDTGLVANQLYRYRVRSFNEEASPYSNTISVITFPVDTIPPPNQPTELVGEPVSDSEISLRWEDNSTSEDIFIIERSISANGEFFEIGEVLEDVTSFQDTDLDPNQRYFYRVAASNEGGLSQYSNVVSVRPECVLVVDVVVEGIKFSDICDDKAALLSLQTNVINASYQWYRNGKEILNATLSTYFATENGEYDCEVSASASCIKRATNPLVVILDDSFSFEVFNEDGFLQADIIGADSYQWYYEFEIIPGATGDSYRPTQSGLYYVVATSENCSVTSDLIQVEITSLENHNLSGAIQIYPIPSGDEVDFSLESTVQGDYTLHLVNPQGKRVLLDKGRKLQTRLQKKINLHNYPSGVYFVEFQSGAYRGLKKIVKF